MTITEIIQWIVMPIITLICGGGWFINYRAKKMQAEADSWKAQQDVYQQTIQDLKDSCAYIRDDRNLLREENKKLRDEANEWRNKYNELEKMISELRKEIARQGRKLEGVLPFVCGVVACPNRTRIELKDKEENNNGDNAE